MLRVLIADDEPKICMLIANIVDWTALGYEIIGTVHNGEDAFRMIEEAHPDVVISDIRMPGCDGIELITRTKAEHPEIFFIIISGYSQFRYAQQALKQGAEDYLLKPIKETELRHILMQVREKYDQTQSRQEELTSLRSEVGRSRSRLRENLLQEMLLPGNESRQYTHAEVNAACGTSFHKNWLLAVIHIYLPDAESHQDLLQLLLSKIQVLAVDRLNGLPNDTLTAVRGDEILFLADTDPSQQMSAANLFSMLRSEALAAMSDIADFSALVSLSTAAEPPVSIWSLYRDAERALDMRMLSSASLFRAGEASPAGESSGASCLSDSARQELALSIRYLDEKQLDVCLNGIKAAIRGASKTSEDLRSCFRELSVYLLGCVADILPQNAIPDESAFFALLGRSPDLDAFFNALGASLCCRFEEVRQARSSRDNLSVKDAELYILNHLSDQLRLDGIAEQFGYNTSYFSSLFKKETGRNFSDYVTELRIEKAQQLLVRTADSILEICAAVGYNDSKHFTKTFRKITGLSPRQYRKLYS